MGVSEALHITQANISRQALYKRVEKARAKEREKESAERAAESLLFLGAGNVSRPTSAALSPPPPKGVSSTVTPGTSARKARPARPLAASSVTLGKRKPPYSAGTTTLNDARHAAIDTLPTWVDRDATTDAMTKRPKMTRQDRCQRNFDEQSVERYRWAKFSNAWKGATQELHGLQQSGKTGSRGCGTRAVAERWNETVLSSPGDHKIKKTSLYLAVKHGNFGVSPPKRGRPRKVPKVATDALAAHATMLQIAGEGEATKDKMTLAAQGLIGNTEWDGNIKPDYMWWRTYTDNPALMLPVMAKDNDDRRVDWLTFSNINSWTDAAKAELISIGLVKDEPGYISECVLTCLNLLVRSIDISPS